MLLNQNAGRRLHWAWGAILLLAGAAASAQDLYPTPEQAVQALLAAVESEQPAAMQAVFGPNAQELGSGDPVADASDRSRFLAQAAAGRRVQVQGEDRAELLLGPEDWPFAVPLVREEGGWRFDTAAGLEELANRRIGRNELHAIATARAIVEAQHEYAARDPTGSGRHQYARRFASTEGRRDGLYWPAVEGTPESPLGPLVAQAIREGYGGSGGGAPYHGYYYRILEAQGEHAAGGARSYLQDGHMVGGFALVAYPAEYGRSGIMTLIVDSRGLMFQRDLGPETETLAAAIDAYDPGPDWVPVLD
jgi:hypothetical protein